MVDFEEQALLHRLRLSPGKSGKAKTERPFGPRSVWGAGLDLGERRKRERGRRAEG